MQRKFLDYNTLQYTIADPRYAVDYYTDGTQFLVASAALRTPASEQVKIASEWNRKTAPALRYSTISIYYSHLPPHTRTIRRSPSPSFAGHRTTSKWAVRQQEKQGRLLVLLLVSRIYRGCTSQLVVRGVIVIVLINTIIFCFACCYICLSIPRGTC